MANNEFAKISQLVDTIVTTYRTTRKECGFSDDARHSKSIERKAKPFLKGYFTLAVVGKVSSGKSTFINALLESKGLLPVGHELTTCGITSIEYGDTPEATLTFGDGHKTSVMCDIAVKIRPYITIPEEYHNLPVNHIDSMILGGFDFKQIWDTHKQLEEETLCTKINKNLLKDYVSHREKKDIVVGVRIKYPFNETLKGWRVIDTQGISAIGGIGLSTKKLFAIQKNDGSRRVDAIIFLLDGSKGLESETKKFVQEQFDNFAESDKTRLFFVLTHSASIEFLEHKESKYNTIKLYNDDKIKYLTCVDSLLRSFINFNENHDIDLEAYDDIEKPEGWETNEWQAVLSILDNVKRDLQNEGDAVNNETMSRKIKAWANFDELESILNQYTKYIKQDNLKQLVKLIAEDYNGFIQQLQEDNKLVDSDLTRINKEISELKNKRTVYNNRLKHAKEDFKTDQLISRFQFIDREIEKINEYPSIIKVCNEVINLFDKVRQEEKTLCDEIKSLYAIVLKGHDTNDIIIDSIDFDSIEKEAARISEENYEITHNKIIKNLCNKEAFIKAKYGKKVNEEKRIREFKELIKSEAKSNRDSFLLKLWQKFIEMHYLIAQELDQKLNEEHERLDALKQIDKESSKARNKAYIEIFSQARVDLEKILKDYGFEFK